MPGGSGKFVMVPVGPAGPSYRPDHDYFSISLLAVYMPASGFLKLSRFAPVVWASVTHNAFDGENGRKRLLGLYPGASTDRPKFARDDRVTLVDLQLVPRVIAREELDVDFTLATVREKDFLAGVLKTATEIAASPAAAFVSQIVPGAKGASDIAKSVTQSANSIKASIDDLLDSDKVKSFGRYQQTLRAPMSSGTFAFIESGDGAQGLTFDPQTRLLANSKGPITSPYAVVRLMCETTRPDWMSLPDLVQAWTRIRETRLAGGDVAAAIDHFRLTAQTSPDLTPADAVKLTAAVQQKFAPELAGQESGETGDMGDMESALGFFMQDGVGAEEAASIDLPPHLAEGPFQRSLQMALRHDGGFVDHPADRGGPTNRGITLSTWRAYLRTKTPAIPDAECTAATLRETSADQVAEIYYQGYWRPARCVDMPNEALAAVSFDAAINHGPAQAIRLLQQGAGMAAFDCDGKWGPRTRAKLKSAAADSVGLVDGMLLARERFYRQIVRDDPSQGVFLRGWMNRLSGLKAYATTLLAGAPPGQDTESVLLDDTCETVQLRAADADFDAFANGEGDNG